MKTKIKKIDSLVIEVTTEDLYKNTMAQMNAVMWDLRNTTYSEREERLDEFKTLIERILSGNENRIFEAFRDGSVVYMIPEIMVEFEKYPLIEIVVTPHTGGPSFTISHKDIKL